MMKPQNRVSKGLALALAVCIAFSGLLVFQAANMTFMPRAAAKPSFLNVTLSGPSKLNVNETGVYTASVNNSQSGKLSYSWSVSPADNRTVLVEKGEKAELTFTSATEDAYTLSVTVQDTVVGNNGYASTAVYDPYTAPDQYLGANGAPYSYMIETDD